MGKLPAAGRVKTRLTPTLSPEAAAQVHQLFLQHTLGRLATCVGEGLLRASVFCFDPPDAGDAARDLTGDRAAVLAQAPGDLGDRLHAARAAVDGPALFFGCDSPDVPRAHVAAAVATMAGVDLVLGPCADGGFWCMGVADGVEIEGIMAGVPWSSGRELAAVRANAAAAGLRVAEAPAWSDVDRPADLAILWARLATAPESTPAAALRDGLARLVPPAVLRPQGLSHE